MMGLILWNMVVKILSIDIDTTLKLLVIILKILILIEKY